MMLLLANCITILLAILYHLYFRVRIELASISMKHLKLHSLKKYWHSVWRILPTVTISTDSYH